MDLVAAGCMTSTAAHHQYMLTDAAEVIWHLTGDKIRRFECHQHLRVDGVDDFARAATSWQCTVRTGLRSEPCGTLFSTSDLVDLLADYRTVLPGNDRSFKTVRRLPTLKQHCMVDTVKRCWPVSFQVGH